MVLPRIRQADDPDLQRHQLARKTGVPLTREPPVARQPRKGVRFVGRLWKRTHADRILRRKTESRSRGSSDRAPTTLKSAFASPWKRIDDSYSPKPTRLSRAKRFA